jgi:undecaprenyl-diphosphatase
MEIITNIDTWLFYLLNVGLANPLFDKLMPFVTNAKHWMLVYVFLLGWMLWKGGTRGRIFALVLILAITATDQINSSLLKEWVGRIRPCHIFEDINLLVPCGGGKSFPSSHAANNFTAAIILMAFKPEYKWLYFSIAALMALSRVFVGVHFPLDIIGGALVGLGIGYAFARLGKFLLKKIEDRKKKITA